MVHFALGWGPRRPTIARSRAPCRVSCSAETQHVFRARLASCGRAPPDVKTLHPVAQEAWNSIHSIYSLCFETPLLAAPWLADQAAEGGSVHLKCENRQATGSFKARGAAHKLFSLTDEQLRRGVVVASTGNHALAVAAAARAASQQRGGLPVPLRIHLPSTVSAAKAERLRAEGAELVLHGSDCVEAEAAARRDAKQRGSSYVSPYNDVRVAGGQGSIAVELLMQLPSGTLDTVFVPVGGGGLASGIASVLKAADPAIHVVGCQPAASDVMRQSVAEGRVVDAEWRETLSEGTVGGIEQGTVTLEPCSRFVDEWVTVSEEEIAAAVVDVGSHTGMQVEGAAGVAVAAFQRLAPQMRNKHCVVILCGGNISGQGMDEVYRVVGRRRPAAVAT